MSRTSFQHFHCSLARVADIIGDKWTLLILRDAMFGLRSFSQFQKNLGVARNILADRLERLVEHGILEKAPIRPGVERYEYRLSASGKELLPILVAMLQWGDKWIFGNEGEPLRLIDREYGAPLQSVGVQARDGRYLKLEDLSFELGPNPGPHSPKP